MEFPLHMRKHALSTIYRIRSTSKGHPAIPLILPQYTGHPSVPSIIFHPRSFTSITSTRQDGLAASNTSNATSDVSLATEVSGVTLRPYQAHAIQACLEALSSGLTRIGVSSPTGSGKTTMFMYLIPLINSNIPNAPHSSDTTKEPSGRGKTLIVVGSVELANQSEKAAKRILGKEWTVEVEQSKRVSSGKADVTIATYQTLNNLDRLAKFDPKEFKVVIVDEAHHAAAHSYLRLLHYFNHNVQIPPSVLPISSTSSLDKMNVPIIGFSATFSRPDQLALSAVFEKIVFHRGISEMLEDGWLSPARSTTVHAKLDLESVEENDQGDYKASSLASKLNTQEIRDLIVGTYLHKASDRRSTLIFCVDLNHVAELTDAFRQAGIDARSISSLSKPEIRKQTVLAFGRGEFPVLINCEVLTEGADIPQIDCVILARPTKSRNLLAQMVGRGLRLSPETGKQDCHIIDIVDSVNKAGGMLVSPTLWGLSHEEKEEQERERGESQLSQQEQPSDHAQGDYKITFIDQDDPFRLAGDSRPIVDKASNNAWVACGEGKYILEAMGNGYLAIDPSSPTSQAKYTITYRNAIPPELTGPRGSRSPFGRVKTVGHADELERALQTGDKYIERILGRDLYLQLSRYASWRRKPASEKAIKLLLKLKGADDPTSLLDDRGQDREIELYGKKMNVASLTAGEVSSWLCAARHGAKTAKAAEDRKIERALAKQVAKEEKARALRERNLPLPRSIPTL
ncbi:hypothetical protein L486_04180 [Kwoniella mangroviensis CBS 10435]|uniref:DEAD box family helicase n=1 Tax=Kwoniella mangroviensis CBS 10435 TaxID=1331196 RepID=A0A1B9IRQ3_9TREE|nr:hypothetical protein L486_04180 [Kwoniella mangroviensis CBS 10435]